MILLLGAWCVQAAEIEGIKLADKVRVGDSGPELILNGAGVRTRVVFKVYTGRLYLTQKRNSAAAVLSDNSARGPAPAA